MQQTIHQAVESFVQIPDGLEHPLQTTAVVGGTAVAMAIQAIRYHISAERQAAAFSNPALLEASIQPGRSAARYSRMGPVGATLLGGGLIAANWLGNPTYETAAPNHDANVVVVQDESFSMLNTSDLGDPTISRAQAAANAIDVTDYQGNFGVVQMGANSHITIPLGKRTSGQEASLTKPAVDPNGGQLVQAMDLAASLFPVADHKTSASNTEVIITDGTVDDTVKDIASETAKLQKAGLTVKFVVMGTPEGKYTLKDSTVPVSSGAEANRFAQVSGKDVVEAKTVAAVNKAIHEDIHTAGVTHNKHEWLVPGVLGAVLLGAGILTDQYQRPRRVV